MAGKHLSMLVNVFGAARGADMCEQLDANLGGVLDHRKAKLRCAGEVSDHRET
jgi:hypothetical protein